MASIINLTRVFERSKIALTDAGQQLSDFLDYMAQFTEQVIRSLRNGLTFQDNFNAKVAVYKLTHNVATAINTNNKRPVGMFAIRTQSETNALSSLNWFFTSQGEVSATATFIGSPTNPIDVTVVILF